MIELSPEQNLALAFGGRRVRDIATVLLRFDRQLAKAMPQSGPPLVGQVRLAWWREQIVAPATRSNADPVLADVRRLLPAHADRKALAGVVDGWETLLAAENPGNIDLAAYAEGRGGTLFGLAARLIGSAGQAEVTRAGAIWALADLARHASAPELAERALLAARGMGKPARSLPKPLRPLSLLCRFAEIDAERGLVRLGPAGSPRRIFQAWKFVLGFD